LGLSVDDVFPIAFDVSSVVREDKDAAMGRILAEPEERLTRAEMVALAVG
jgi:hypothetical protein